VFPAAPVQAPMICCICSRVRLGRGGGDVASVFVSELGVDEDAIVFLLLGTVSVSSMSDSSSELSVTKLVACEG